MKTIRALFRFSIACLAWISSIIYFLASKATYHLTRFTVSNETRDIFVGKKTFGEVYSPPDYRQKLIDLLNGESEVVVGFVREIIEKTKPGQLAIRHVSDRHPYAVMVPNKQENITRILNIFDVFPQASLENTYIVIERAIENFHNSGVTENEKKTL